VLLVAMDREQAGIINRYIKSYFAAIPELKAMVVSETKTGLELNNGVEIVIATNDYRSVRGRTVLAAILDECAFYRSEESASPDIELDRAISPAQATLPASIKFLISSPHKKSGLLWNKHKASFGRNDDRVLVLQAPTLKLNPTFDPVEIELAMESDPAAARAEYFAEFRSDLSNFVDPETIERAITPGVNVRPPRSDCVYYAFADPASGSGGDSMCLAICHHEKERRVLDAIVERRPPFSPDQVCEEFSAVLKSYRVATVTGDRWALGWPTERFQAHGIRYELAAKPKSELYLTLLPLLNSGRCDLLDNPRMVSQFVNLERRTVRGGRDVVDHPTGRGSSSHDDISNVCAGSLTTAADDTPGIIAFYIQENARDKRLADEAALQESELVSVRCPRGTSSAYGRTGVLYNADERGFIRVKPADVNPLCGAGFARVEPEGVAT
jgi:hypothetical protein